MIYLRQIRRSRKISMKELGKKVGVSEAAIGYYETEKRKIKYEMLLKLSEALDCTVNDIMYGEKNPVTESDGLEENIDLSQLSEDRKKLIQDILKASDQDVSFVLQMTERLLSGQ